MSIGVGQRRTGRCFDAQMSQLALATLQPAFNLSQRVSAANWQNSMATNWFQLDSPLLRRSAFVALTRRLKSARGISLSIWLNMLHDAFTLGLLRLGNGGFGDSPMHYTSG